MSTKLGTLTLDLVTRIGGFTQGMRDASASAEREMGRAGNSVNTMDGLLKKLAVTAGTVFSVGQIVNYADSYTGMVNKLKLVTASQGELSQAMADTHKIAQDTASEWSGVIDVYTKFQGLAKKLGIDQTEVARITETVAKAVSMSGQSAAASEAALLQFGQALNTGVLRGAELTSVMSQAAPLAKALADGMGVAVGDLKKLGEEGKITSEKMRDALLKMSSSVDAEYAKTATTVAASFNYMKNEAIQAVGEFDAVTGASAKFVEGMKTLSENIGVITTAMGIGAAYMAGTYIPVIYGASLAVKDKMATQIASMRADQLANAITAQRTARIAHLTSIELANAEAQLARMSGIARLAYLEATVIPLRKANTAALTADTVAQNANNRSKNLGVMAGGRLAATLLGPVGMGVALATVAAGYIYMSSKGAEANEMLESQSRYAGMAADELLRLDGAKRKAAQEELSKEVGILNDKLKASENQFEALVEKVLDSNSANAEAKKIWSELRAGAISVDEAYSRLNQTDFVTSKQINQLTDGKKKVDDAKGSLKQAETAQKALNTASESASQAHKEQKNSVDKLAKSYADLSKEQQKALDKIKESTNSNIYVQEFVKAGGSKEKAEFFLDYKKSASMQPKDRLSKYEISQLNTGFNAQNYSFKAADLKAIAKVNGIASANNFAQIEGLYGLPKGSLAALVLQESSGNASAVSETGALGLFQTTGIFRKEYGLNSKSSIEAQASAAAKDLAKNLKEFGSLEKALMAYNAGAGGTRQYLAGNIGNGKNQMSTAKAKEVASYASGWSKWYAGVNGKSSIDQNVLTPSDSDKLAQVNAAADSQKLLSDTKLEIDSKYYTQTESLAEENRKAIEKINLTLGGEPKALKASLAKQAELFKNQTTELELNKKAEYQSYFEFETDRITQITQSYNIEKGLVQTNAEYSKAKKQELSDALERQKQQEIDAVKREEAQMIQAATQAYQTETAVVIARYKIERDEILKNYTLTKDTRQKLLEANSMGIFYERNLASSDLFDKTAQSREYLFQRNNPVGYDEWSMQNQYSSASSSLFDSFSKDLAGANGIEDEEERNAQLLETHERYLEAKAALDDEYAQRERDLRQSQYESQLGLYGNLLSQASSVWGSMTDMVKESKGEQSKTYKAMFLAQQAIAIGQQIINTELAAMQPIAQMGIYGIPASALIRGMGYASVGIIAAQTVAGMAHDGIDNIPREGTWLLDKGERVVDRRTNGDLKDFIAKGGNGGVTVNVNVPVGYIGKQSTDAEGNVTIDVVKREILNSWSNLGRANSHESRQLEAYGAPRTR